MRALSGSPPAALALLLSTGVLGVGAAPLPARAEAFADRQEGALRVQEARRRTGPRVRALFAEKGVAYPPVEVVLRHFKAEGELELWAGPGPGQSLTLIKTYAVCARSGGLGPKRQRGDLQVPEGFYVVDRYNAWSSYHLSLGIDYPNEADRRASRRLNVERPGGDIFVHGDCVTIGCVPIEDGPIEELYLVALDQRLVHGGEVQVHMFPSRLDDARYEQLRPRAPRPAVARLWKALKRGYDVFERTRRPLHVDIDEEGRYVVSPLVGTGTPTPPLPKSGEGAGG